MLILLPGILAISIYKQLTRNFLSQGKPIYGAAISAFGLFTAILLDIFLIPRYGITGGAAASTMSFSIMSIIGLYLFLKKSKITICETLFINKRDLREIWAKLRSFEFAG